jgi:glycine cleavage system pyridoxal-binding protein P
VHGLAHVLHANLQRLGCSMSHDIYFDTVTFRAAEGRSAAQVVKDCAEAGYNVRALNRRFVFVPVVARLFLF